MSSEKPFVRVNMKKLLSKVGVLAAAVAFSAGALTARAQDQFDWKVTTGAAPVSGYVPAPFLTDANAASVSAFLQTQPAGKVAVKLQTPVSAATVNQIFNNPNYTVNYAFLDFETPTASGGNADIAAAQAQAQAIHGAAKGTNTAVGNFRLFPGNGDTSGPTAGPTLAQYLSGGATGVNMANEDLYPGSPYYKNPGSVGGSSTAPNIRSTLFTLPIERASFVSANLPTGHKHIPYVNRFNNFGNTALDSDGNSANGFQFNNPTGNQLLSRGDFSALVAHYRLRGVDAVHLLDGGVVGYTQTQFETDAKAGFTFAPIANIFSGGGARLATLDTVSRVDGAVKDNEASGVVFSGVYSLTQGTGKLALLVSNLDEVSHAISFPNKIGGKTVAGNFTVADGQHRLLEFTGSGTQWQLTANTAVFVDSDRSGVGVPEPMALGGLGIFGVGMLFRRGRRN